jgi:MoxR-vWA-beta-propeller ternary system protein
VFPPSFQELAPVDLLSKVGLESQLASLRPEAHPGAALPAFQRALEAPAATDVVIVTHRDVLADPAFQRAQFQLEAARRFSLVVERDGTVQLWPLPATAPRPLCEARIAVAQLLAEPSAPPGAVPPPLIDEAANPDLPVIFRLRPFPLLLPVNAKMEYATPLERGGMCVTGDNRLLRWEGPDRGAQHLATDLPGGRTAFLQVDPAGRTLLVKGRSGSGQMAVVMIPATTAPACVTRFNGPHHPRAVFRDGEALVIVLHTRLVVVSCETTEVLYEAPTEAGITWIYGRYFRRRDEMVFASWDGAGIRWDTLVVGRSVPAKDVLSAFDRDGIGAWVVTRDGRVLTPTGQEYARFDFAPDHLQISRDHETLLAFGPGPQKISLHLPSRKMQNAAQLKNFEQSAVVPPTRTLQSAFTAIQLVPGQPLRLQRAKGGWLEVFPSGSQLRLVESVDQGPPLPVGARTFSAISSRPALGCTLKVAVWADGTRAWLDSRGLLHLRSSNHDLPSLSLVLHFKGSLAAWCGDGARCGPSFFHPKPIAESDTAALKVLGLIQRHANACRRS